MCCSSAALVLLMGPPVLNPHKTLGDLWRWTHATQTWTRLHAKAVGTPAWRGPIYTTPDHYRYWRTPDGLCWLQMEQEYLGSESGYVRGLWTYDPIAGTWDQHPYGEEAVPGLRTGDTPNTFEGAIWMGQDGRAWCHGGVGGFFQDYLYSHGPAQVPEVNGWLSIIVSPKGVVTWTGMLGDGTPVTGSSGLSVRAAVDGSRDWMLRYAPTGDFMSVQGRMTLTPGPGRPCFRVTSRPSKTCAPPPSVTAGFRSGWPFA